MKTYEKILQEKIAYYGNTEAAREFAAREYYEGWIRIEDERPPFDEYVLAKGTPVNNFLPNIDIVKFVFKKGLISHSLILATHWRPIHHD